MPLPGLCVGQHSKKSMVCGSILRLGLPQLARRYMTHRTHPTEGSIVFNDSNAFALFRCECQFRCNFGVTECPRTFRLQPDLPKSNLLFGCQDCVEFCFVNPCLSDDPAPAFGRRDEADIAERFHPLLPHA